METESSLSHSRESSTGPYPKPDQSSPYHLILSVEDPSKYDPPTCVLVLLVV
jgi:hypothetical protein